MDFTFSHFSRQVQQQGNEAWFEWEILMNEPIWRLYDEVAQVEYHLHPSLPDPIQVVRDPQSRFALQGHASSSFTVRIIVYLKNGREEWQDYELNLERSPDLGQPW